MTLDAVVAELLLVFEGVAMGTDFFIIKPPPPPLQEGESDDDAEGILELAAPFKKSVALTAMLDGRYLQGFSASGELVFSCARDCF